jgi:hypothetical protein
MDYCHQWTMHFQSCILPLVRSHWTFSSTTRL